MWRIACRHAQAEDRIGDECLKESEKRVSEIVGRQTLDGVRQKLRSARFARGRRFQTGAGGMARAEGRS